MAVLHHSIGAAQFVVLLGQAIPPRAEPIVDKRPGGGTEVIRTGLTGQPFTLRSGVDCQDVNDAESLFEFYQSMIEQDPVALRQDSIFSAYKYVVLDVVKVERQAIRHAQGGLNPPSEAWLACDWTLIAATYNSDNS